MLRPSVRKVLNVTLDSSEYFTFNDFKVIESENFEGSKIYIEYEYKPEYYCEIILPDKTSTLTKEEIRDNPFGITGSRKIHEYQEYVITAKISPGSLSRIENIERNGRNSFVDIMKLWMDNLWQDLTDEPVNRAFKIQKEEIEELKNRFDSVSEEYFSKEEAQSMIEKLDSLEEEFKKKIQAQFDEHEDVDRRIRELEKEIQQLKTTINSLNKRGWFKSFTTKTFRWLSKTENQELLKSGKNLIQTLLTENIKE